MAKTRGPLLSFGASGQVGKTQVYSKWKGRGYARAYVIPSNPQTADQSLTRDTFKWLNAVYKTAPTEMTDAWDAGASGRVMTGRNLFVKDNLALLRGTISVPVTSNDDMVFSPGAKAGFAAAGISLTPGNDQVAATLTAPTLPDGWTIDSAVFLAIREQDPQTGTLYDVAAMTDNTDPYTVTFTGLASAQTYVVGGFFKYLRPDGKFAYGRSISDTALTT